MPAMPKRLCRSLVIAIGTWAAEATGWDMLAVALSWRAPRLEPRPGVAGTPVFWCPDGLSVRGKAYQPVPEGLLEALSIGCRPQSR
jgi:hypothetical protein